MPDEISKNDLQNRNLLKIPILALYSIGMLINICIYVWSKNRFVHPKLWPFLLPSLGLPADLWANMLIAIIFSILLTLMLFFISSFFYKRLKMDGRLNLNIPLLFLGLGIFVNAILILATGISSTADAFIIPLLGWLMAVIYNKEKTFKFALISLIIALMIIGIEVIYIQSTPLIGNVMAFPSSTWGSKEAIASLSEIETPFSYPKNYFTELGYADDIFLQAYKFRPHMGDINIGVYKVALIGGGALSFEKDMMALAYPRRLFMPIPQICSDKVTQGCRQVLSCEAALFASSKPEIITLLTFLRHMPSATGSGISTPESMGEYVAIYPTFTHPETIDSGMIDLHTNLMDWTFLVDRIYGMFTLFQEDNACLRNGTTIDPSLLDLYAEHMEATLQKVTFVELAINGDSPHGILFYSYYPTFRNLWIITKSLEKDRFNEAKLYLDDIEISDVVYKYPLIQLKNVDLTPGNHVLKIKTDTKTFNADVIIPPRKIIATDFKWGLESNTMKLMLANFEPKEILIKSISMKSDDVECNAEYPEGIAFPNIYVNSSILFELNCSNNSFGDIFKVEIVDSNNEIIKGEAHIFPS